MTILGFKESIIYNSKSFPLNNALFIVHNTQFRVMQVIIFVLFFLWTAKLKRHEMYIFVRTAKLKCMKFVILPEPQN